MLRTYTIFRGYDDDSRAIETTYPNGKVVDRTFTDRNQLDQVDYDTSMVAEFEYDAGMRETFRGHGNTLITRRVYGRSDNLPTAIVNETILNWNDRPDASFSYTYDANKNVVSETTGSPGSAMEDYSWTTSGGLTPGYDAKDRLTYWTRSSSGGGTINEQAWPHNPGTTGLSLVGDWTTVDIDGTTESRTFNDVHEILTRDPGGGSQSLAHDAKGNLTRKAGDANDRYTWDFDNRMSAADTDVDGTDDLAFTYDALGRRVSKDDGTNVTVYVCTTSGGGASGGMGQVVAEYTANADPSTTPAVQTYVYGSYVDEPLMKVDASGGKLYYHTNRQFSVTALTNASGAVVERYAYTAYGVTTVLAPDGSTVRATTSEGNPYMYTGRRLDAEFAATSEDAIYYYRARYHDPNLGRFLGRDPMGYVDGMSTYAYYAGMRQTVDPTGKQAAAIAPCLLFDAGAKTLPSTTVRPAVAVPAVMIGATAAAWGNRITLEAAADRLNDYYEMNAISAAQAQSIFKKIAMGIPKDARAARAKLQKA